MTEGRKREVQEPSHLPTLRPVTTGRSSPSLVAPTLTHPLQHLLRPNPIALSLPLFSPSQHALRSPGDLPLPSSHVPLVQNIHPTRSPHHFNAALPVLLSLLSSSPTCVSSQLDVFLNCCSQPSCQSSPPPVASTHRRPPRSLDLLAASLFALGSGMCRLHCPASLGRTAARVDEGRQAQTNTAALAKRALDELSSLPRDDSLELFTGTDANDGSFGTTREELSVRRVPSRLPGSAPVTTAPISPS